MQPDCSSYDAIIEGRVPIIDVRAPSEFERGKIPNTINLPILNDDERHQVGIAYKKQGSQSAIDLGHQLVQGTIKEYRVDEWIRYLNSHPKSAIACWRGGLRSQITQQWLLERGYTIPRVIGGFKAIRQRCISVLEDQAHREYIVIAGQTGVGKTQFINQWIESIDLEGLANHRGSSFGRLSTPQPTSVEFEFSLARLLLKTSNASHILLEDESRMIGKLSIPKPVFEALQKSPICVLHAGFDDRVQYTFDLYVKHSPASLLLDAIERIRKRLGEERYKEIGTLMQRACSTHSEELHKSWIAKLLETYYDPMYEYQLSKKRDRVMFEGDRTSLLDFLENQYNLKLC